MQKNNLFIQRRFTVEKEGKNGLINLIGSIYVAYYFFKNNELHVAKYALCVKYSKTEAELKQLMKK